ncbi:MAG: hypothetical protein CVU56_13850 [Deltaproteobacteria bacterium HGW-Deltaproteobacteria-14]|nr:MAG: hypothetical protein CVU56_13850 [Deltaproteobacteria bacterium HGW-Deltaproteobacteria-14]
MSPVLWLVAALSVAHSDPAPRGVAVGVRGGRPALAVTVIVQPPSEVRTLEALGDRDHDGQLDGDEAARIERALAADAARTVALTLDGVALPLETELEASFGVRGQTGGQEPFGVAVRAEARTLVFCGLHLVELEARAGGPGLVRVIWPDGATETLHTGQRARRVVMLCGEPRPDRH